MGLREFKKKQIKEQEGAISSFLLAIGGGQASGSSHASEIQGGAVEEHTKVHPPTQRPLLLQMAQREIRGAIRTSTNIDTCRLTVYTWIEHKEQRTTISAQRK